MNDDATHILIVEDSATQAMRLEHTLKRHGYRVSSARHGREALTVLSGELPTMVITDVNMPEMDGYELCRHIKDDAKLKELPVILLTALSDPKDILRGIECGADNFVVKPYDEEFLLSRIQYVLANLELRRQSKDRSGTEIFFAGQKYHLTFDRIRNLDLLLSTYETAVQKNLELSKAKETLEKQAIDLREKNEQMAADLEMARELQTAFLPHAYPRFPKAANPEESALRFCHRYHATTELGGDFFDIMGISDTVAGIFICDVMGHGVRAALVTAIVRGLLEESGAVASDPGLFLTQMNRNLCEILKQTLTPLFASAFYMVVDLSLGEMSFACAGHPSPLLIRSNATVEPLETSGGKPSGAMGIFEKSEYATLRRPITPGDRFLLFTDGLYEVESADNSYYDMDQLIEAVRKRAALPTEALCDDLMSEIKSFAVHQTFDDDVCLVGVDVIKLANGHA